MSSEEHPIPTAEPRVSIVIPAYGCAHTIADVLEAALAQTVQPLQIIVVNDRSPDQLDQAVQPYLNRIEYVRNEVNLGLARTYNVGLRRTRAPYVMTLHSDCLLDPTYIETLLAHLERDPQLGVATGQYLFPAPRELGRSDRLFAGLNLLPVETDRRDTGVHALSFIEGKADLFRRAVIERYGFFSENLVLTAEDQDLSAKMRRDGFTILQDQRARFRVKFTGTSDSLWKVLRKQRTYARGQVYVILRYGRSVFGETTPNRRLRAWHRVGQLLFASGLLIALVLAGLAPALAWVPLALIAMRMFIYAQLTPPTLKQDRWLIALLGPLADVLYWIGALEGTIKTLLFRRT